MELRFERGSREKPKGHALLYFNGASGPDEVWATYLVMLPISVDVSKYVPPFLMNQMGEFGPKDLSAFAFPPAPELVEGLQYLETLADMRGDDLIHAGTYNSSNVPGGMMDVSLAVQSYAELYGDYVEGLQPSDAGETELPGGLGVNEVLYGLMSDSDRLSELTKLVGKLRFAVEGGEDALATEAETDIDLLVSHLPENHKVARLIESVKAEGAMGARLASLYLQRCFHLIREDYVQLGEIEDEINALEKEGPNSEA